MYDNNEKHQAKVMLLYVQLWSNYAVDQFPTLLQQEFL